MGTESGTGRGGRGEEAANSLVDKQGRGVGPRGLQVLHGVPLVDAALLGADAALVVGGPEKSHAPGEVVVSSCHFAGLVKDLQGGPGVRRAEGQAWEAQASWVLPSAKGFKRDGEGQVIQDWLLGLPACQATWLVSVTHALTREQREHPSPFPARKQKCPNSPHPLVHRPLYSPRMHSQGLR